MENSLLIGIVQITLLNLALSGDNIGIIALATRNLPEKHARKASMFGIIAAVILRIIFACFIAIIINIQWLPVKLIGGVLLAKITLDFVKPKIEEENSNIEVSDKFWQAVKIITIADITMSLDNVLATAAVANGNISLIIFGILLNIPILFFGSQIIANLMKKYVIVIYFAGALLAYTSFRMILDDRLILPHISHFVLTFVPWVAAISVLAYGFSIIRNTTIPAKEEN